MGTRAASGASYWIGYTLRIKAIGRVTDREGVTPLVDEGLATLPGDAYN